MKVRRRKQKTKKAYLMQESNYNSYLKRFINKYLQIGT